jgi:hypothetical protein
MKECWLKVESHFPLFWLNITTDQLRHVGPDIGRAEGDRITVLGRFEAAI